MKKLEAIIKPHKLTAVTVALAEIGVDAMTISEVKGYGRWGYGPERRTQGEWERDFLPQLKLEVVVRDQSLASALDAVLVAAKTGRRGDGKVFVVPVESALRIRTGEINTNAV